MQIKQHIEHLNQQPLSAFKSLYSDLPLPESGRLHGLFRGVFVGPSWLRTIAPKGLALLGFDGWYGKDLQHTREGQNLFLRSGKLERRNPVQLISQPSLVDGNPSIVVSYLKSNPFPWPYVIDELRSLDENCLLGLTITNLPLLNRIALPFLLHPLEDINEL